MLISLGGGTNQAGVLAMNGHRSAETSRPAGCAWTMRSSIIPAKIWRNYWAVDR